MITPDISGGESRASLTEMRLFESKPQLTA
jgi:hypothetical protein